MFSNIKEKLYDKETLRKVIDLINTEGFSKVEEFINNPTVSEKTKETLKVIKDMVEQLRTFDVNKVKYYSNEAFDSIYGEFLSIYNDVFHDGINLDFINSKKEEFDRINHNKSLRFIKELEKLTKEGATKEEIQEVKDKLRLCYNSYLLANKKIKVNDKYHVPISKVDKITYGKMAKKIIEAKKSAEIKFQELSSKISDPKKVKFSLNEKLEKKKDELKDSLISKEEIFAKVEQLKQEKSPIRAKQVEQELKKEIKYNKKINKKIRSKEKLQKLCSVPKKTFNKIKEKLHNMKEKVTDLRYTAKEKIDVGLNNYYTGKQRDFNEIESELIANKKLARQTLEESQKKPLGTALDNVEKEASMDDIAKAIEEALKLDKKEKRKEEKTQSKLQKKIRSIGRKQKLVTFKKELVEKLYNSYFKPEDIPELAAKSI